MSRYDMVACERTGLTRKNKVYGCVQGSPPRTALQVLLPNAPKQPGTAFSCLSRLSVKLYDRQAVLVKAEGRKGDDSK